MFRCSATLYSNGSKFSSATNPLSQKIEDNLTVLRKKFANPPCSQTLSEISRKSNKISIKLNNLSTEKKKAINWLFEKDFEMAKISDIESQIIAKDSVKTTCTERRNNLQIEKAALFPENSESTYLSCVKSVRNVFLKNTLPEHVSKKLILSAKYDLICASYLSIRAKILNHENLPDETLCNIDKMRDQLKEETDILISEVSKHEMEESSDLNQYSLALDQALKSLDEIEKSPEPKSSNKK